MKVKSWLITRLAVTVFLPIASLQSEAYAGSPMPPPKAPLNLPLFQPPFQQPSDLIGVMVEDQNHERFAKIKEVRIDESNPSGSTAIIETMKGGIYEPGMIYSVPLSSFTPSGHGKMVMLKVPLNRAGGRSWR